MLLSGRSLESRSESPAWPHPCGTGCGHVRLNPPSPIAGYGNPYVQIMTLARNGTMDAAARLRVSYLAILATREFVTIK